MNGKGDKDRTDNLSQYRRNYDRIFSLVVDIKMHITTNTNGQFNGFNHKYGIYVSADSLQHLEERFLNKFHKLNPHKTCRIERHIING